MITLFEIGGSLLKRPKGKPVTSNSAHIGNNLLNEPTHAGQFYEIRIKGQLSGIWTDWFDGLTPENLDDGEMRLSGYIVDQSALLGILNKLHRLNLALISLNETKQHADQT